ncbi:MAG: cardiolipin synthase [Lachnospiraceae bacterium]|nr:cardiolipin synthase [Lachnospiraceae bacterium]
MYYSTFYWIFFGVGILTSVEIFSSDSDPTVKLSWIIVVMGLSFVGILFYWFTRFDVGHHRLKKNMENVTAEGRKQQQAPQNVLDDILKNAKSLSNRSNYLINVGGYYPYRNNKMEYYKLGDDMFPAFKEDLRSAKHFIFLEYFIVKEGEMWGDIIEILIEKAANGVEVRLVYDGMNEFVNLPHSYPKELEKHGIKCKIFDPLRPFVSTAYNYRDHRKITVIDGRVAYTGGVNLSDEYINIDPPFGKWKDNGLCVRGPAVATFTRLFLECWNVREEKYDFGDFISIAEKGPVYEEQAGYAIPFGDNPLEKDKIAEQIYLEIINTAKKYVHVMTPYFVIDEVVSNALIYAAKRGVDVKIIIPHIPDKKIAFCITKSFRKRLVRAGVKFYQYTPGFVHSKAIVSDDKKAVVGSINMDYRSFYHHFENGVYMYNAPVVKDVEKDMQDTLKECSQDTLESIKQESWFGKMIGAIGRLIAPMI